MQSVKPYRPQEKPHPITVKLSKCRYFGSTFLERKISIIKSISYQILLDTVPFGRFSFQYAYKLPSTSGSKLNTEVHQILKIGVSGGEEKLINC